MKYIRDDDLKAAFVTMINKLVFGHRMILIPYVNALKDNNKDVSLHRIQELQSLLLENAGQRETLTKLMAQGYIDQILYNEENNALLSQAEQYRMEINVLSERLSGDTSELEAAMVLLKYAEKAVMLDAFDEKLFDHTVNRILVLSRHAVAFELKCGLTLKERM